jgi:CDP-glucose 4,6-dehydratase
VDLARGEAPPRPSFWRGQTVLVTGHTGFKGGWLSTWLLELGARVVGFSLPPDPAPSFFHSSALATRLDSRSGDVRDAEALRRCLADAQPTVVFHLAAQSLVRRSYREPAETFATNVMGTVNVLEAVRAVPSVRAMVVATSDKCYEHVESADGHREGDRLGGSDPYSASKACAELVCHAYRTSLLGGGPGLATVRAGNVFGGGDWAEDRLVPDAIRAIERGVPLEVRHPDAVRPWQHVLDPLRGYLMLAERLATEPETWSGPWNFGPSAASMIAVSGLLDLLHDEWGAGEWHRGPADVRLPETAVLRLDSTKARERLGWSPRLTLAHGIELAVEWYREAQSTDTDLHTLTLAQIGRHGVGGEAA